MKNLKCKPEPCRPDMSDFQTQQASLSQSQALAAAIQRAKQVRRRSQASPRSCLTSRDEKKNRHKGQKYIYYYLNRLPRRFNQTSSNHKEAVEVTALVPRLAEVEVTILSDTTTTAIAGQTVNAPLAVPTTVRTIRT